MSGGTKFRRWKLVLGGIGMPELIVILVLVLVIFGAGKLAHAGKALGASVKGFRESVKETEDEKTQEVK